jgi:hypothetical protein
MKRLIEEGGTRLEVDLLREAQVESPPAGAARRTLAALGVGAAALSSSTAVASAAAGGAKVSMSLMAVKWIAIGVVGGAAVVGGIEGVRIATSPEQRPLAAVAVGERPSQPAALPARAAAEPNGVERVSEVPAVAAPPVAGPPAAPRAERAAAADLPRSSTDLEAPAPAPPATAASASLAPEIAMIDAARRAVAQRRPDEALGILGRYGEQFPRGRFVPEATYLRIEALLQRGDRTAALDLGRRYLASTPDGPQAKHVRAILAASGETIP